MSRKIIIMVSVLAIFSFSPLTFGGEMERLGFNSNPDLFSHITGNMDYHMRLGHYKFENPMKNTTLYSDTIGHTFKHQEADSFSKLHLNKHLSKPYMEPISPMTTRWDSGTHDYMQKQFERSFVNSVPDPSADYVWKKLTNDLCKTANTMISVGTAAVGGPLSKFGAVSNIIHNFGPQTGKIQGVSGNVGDVVTIASISKTAGQAAYGNFSNMGTGVIGLINNAFGKITDAHKNTLRDPVTNSATRHYRFKTNDGFTGTQRVGTITATKTYTPPKTIKPFGPPDIFEGTTRTTFKKHEIITTKTGSFNNSFPTNTYKTPSFKSYQTPSFNNYSTFKTPSFTTPNIKSWSFNTPTYRTPSFSSPSFSTSTFRSPMFSSPSFGGIR